MGVRPSTQGGQVVRRVDVGLRRKQRIGHSFDPAAGRHRRQDRAGSPRHPAEDGPDRAGQGGKVEPPVPGGAEHGTRTVAQLPERQPNPGRGQGRAIRPHDGGAPGASREDEIECVRHSLAEVASALRDAMEVGKGSPGEQVPGRRRREEQVSLERPQARQLLRRVLEESPVERGGAPAPEDRKQARLDKARERSFSHQDQRVGESHRHLPSAFLPVGFIV